MDPGSSKGTRQQSTKRTETLAGVKEQNDGFFTVGRFFHTIVRLVSVSSGTAQHMCGVGCTIRSATRKTEALGQGTPHAAVLLCCSVGRSSHVSHCLTQRDDGHNTGSHIEQLTHINRV